MLPVKSCNGQGVNGDHCCYVGGKACKFLEENVAGRRYACGLRLQHDSWRAVIRDPRYRVIGEYWESVNQPYHYCMSFDPALCCRREVT